MSKELLQPALIERCHRDAADRDCPYFARDTLTKAADMLAAIAQPVQLDPEEKNEDILWQLLNAVTDEMNRRAVPGVWLSLAYTTGSEFITNRRAAIAHSQLAPVALAPEDYSAIRAQLCEARPGEWLHHYGPAVEAEVLKRLRAAA